MLQTVTARYGWRWAFFSLLCFSATRLAYSGWQEAAYSEASGESQHISVTSDAEGWAYPYGHPKLRLSCDATSTGSDMYLGFHFPAGHAFLLQSSINEPVIFEIVDRAQDSFVHETLEYLTRSSAENSAFRSLLASDGMVSTSSVGELIRDLQQGDFLLVHFLRHPDSYSVQYDLQGLPEHLDGIMQMCHFHTFSYAQFSNTLADVISIAEIAGQLIIKSPVLGAADPLPAAVTSEMR